MKVVGQTVQPWERARTNGRTLPSALSPSLRGWWWNKYTNPAHRNSFASKSLGPSFSASLSICPNCHDTRHWMLALNTNSACAEDENEHESCKLEKDPYKTGLNTTCCRKLTEQMAKRPNTASQVWQFCLFWMCCCPKFNWYSAGRLYPSVASAGRLQAPQIKHVLWVSQFNDSEMSGGTL